MLLELLLGGAVWLGAEKMKNGYGGGDKQKIDRIFRKCGLVVKYNGEVDTPKLIRSARKENYTEYIYRIPEGLSFRDFEKKREVIEDSLNSNSEDFTLEDLKRIKLTGSLKKQLQKIQKEKADRKTVRLEFDKVLKLKVYRGTLNKKYDYRKSMTDKCKGWEVQIGVTLDRIVKHDMQKHMIVAGATDFGKTATTKLMITSLLERKPDDTILTLIDLKGGLSFNRFRGIPQLNGFAKDLVGALEVLTNVKDQVHGVFNYLEENGYEDVKEAGIQKRHFIFIDEVAELASVSEKDTEIKKTENRMRVYHVLYSATRQGSRILYHLQHSISNR